MDEWIHIIYKQQYRTLSNHEITWIYCELNELSREYGVRSHVILNNVRSCDKMSSMKHKCHQWHYVNLLISEYLSYNR